jgi:hypothetical protein
MGLAKDPVPDSASMNRDPQHLGSKPNSTHAPTRMTSGLVACHEKIGVVDPNPH